MPRRIWVDDRPLLSDLLVWVESKMEAEPIGLGPMSSAIEQDSSMRFPLQACYDYY
jgi:hypothetical protein